MDITNIIDRLDALVNTSRRMPATRNRLVDEEKIAKLLEQLRLAIPQDIRSAQEVIEKKDAILTQTQLDARRIRNEAEEEFAARLDENELLVAARSQAEAVAEEAERKANRLMEQAESESRRNRADADFYVIEALRNLERETSNVLSSVRKGLDSLGATVPV
jgi:hypothetical protein